jgi:hypothetical protein
MEMDENAILIEYMILAGTALWQTMSLIQTYPRSFCLPPSMRCKSGTSMG